MSLKAMSSLAGVAAVGLMLAGCMFSPTSNEDTREGLGGGYYYTNYVRAVTFGVSGNGWVWHNYNYFDRRVAGRLGDVEFESVGNARLSLGAYNEQLDNTLLHVDVANGTDVTLVFPGDEAGTFNDGADVLIEMDGLRYSSEIEGGSVEITLDAYPEVSGTFHGRVAGTVVNEAGEAVELDATFEVGRAF